MSCVCGGQSHQRQDFTEGPADHGTCTKKRPRLRSMAYEHRRDKGAHRHGEARHGGGKPVGLTVLLLPSAFEKGLHRSNT